MCKKPVQARSWQTVKTIFEATIQVLQEYGESRLTTLRIADRAGFSVGTLYQYFPDKESILLNMIELEQHRVVRELEQLLEQAEASPLSPQAFVRPYIRLLIERFALGNPGRRILLKMAWRLDHRPEVIAMIQHSSARIAQALNTRQHPQLAALDEVGLFVLTRTVLGSIRAAVLEEWPGVDQPAFEQQLVALAEAMLCRPARSA